MMKTDLAVMRIHMFSRVGYKVLIISSLNLDGQARLLQRIRRSPRQNLGDVFANKVDYDTISAYTKPVYSLVRGGRCIST